MAIVSELFIAPVLIAIAAMFVYALFATGRFFSQWLLRRRFQKKYLTQIREGSPSSCPGFHLHNFFTANTNRSNDELEVYALKKLEGLRLVTRLSPMLGLIATMIPMGPALKSLADGNIQGISENLIIAFAAVIWALVISCLTFWPASVMKRWLAEELINVSKLKSRSEPSPVSALPSDIKGAA